MLKKWRIINHHFHLSLEDNFMIGLLKTLAIISIFSINFGHATTDISNDNTKDTDITTNTGLNSAVENIMTDILDTTLEITNNVPHLSN